MRSVQVYPVLRECHLHVDHEGVREAVERVVQVLIRDEADEGEDDIHKDGRAKKIEDDDDDRKIEEIF